MRLDGDREPTGPDGVSAGTSPDGCNSQKEESIERLAIGIHLSLFLLCRCAHLQLRKNPILQCCNFPRRLAPGFGLIHGLSDRPCGAVDPAFPQYDGSGRQSRSLNNRPCVVEKCRGTVRCRIEHNERRHTRRFNKLSGPPYRVDVNQTGATRNEYQVGRLGRRVGLRTGCWGGSIMDKLKPSASPRSPFKAHQLRPPFPCLSHSLKISS